MYPLSTPSFPNVFSVNILSFSSVQLSSLARVNFHCTILPRPSMMMCSLKPKNHPIVPLPLVADSLNVLYLLAHLSCHTRNRVKSMIEIPAQLPRQQLLRKKFIRNHLLILYKAIIGKHDGKEPSPHRCISFCVESLKGSVA